MAPTEETILRSFLLQKAGLRDVLTLAEFSSYFPPSKRSSPLVRHLYRDLQVQRNAICESVLKQIRLECRLGDNLVAQRRAARESTKKAESGATENEIDSQVCVVR
jgi:Cnl2/NKP2 family protein